MKTDKKVVNSLQYTIRAQVAIIKFISDHAQYEFINCKPIIIQVIFIDYCQSEPHYQHQNFYDLRYQIVKRFINTILGPTGAPDYMWLLDLIYVLFLLNHTHAAGINVIPTTKATVYISDISPLLHFYFWKPVNYKVYDSYLPSPSTEKHGHCDGISEHVGHDMTFKVLTDETHKIFFSYNL